MNQTSAVKKHLESGKTLTSMEAFKLYGCTRLSAKIFDLRCKGYVIDSVPTTGKTRFGDDCHFVTYRFVSKPEGVNKN